MTETILERLYAHADADEQATIAAVAARAGITTVCACTWAVEPGHRCENCGETCKLSGFVPRDYVPPPNQVVSGQYYDARTFGYADERSLSDRADRERVEAAVDAYVEAVSAAAPGRSFKVSIGVDRVFVDMSDWPEEEIFPPSVEDALKAHGVAAHD